MQSFLNRDVPFNSSGQALSERTQSRSGIAAIYSHFSQSSEKWGTRLRRLPVA